MRNYVPKAFSRCAECGRRGHNARRCPGEPRPRNQETNVGLVPPLRGMGKISSPTARFFHRSSPQGARAILAKGFRDRRGYYLTSNVYSGVWLSNVPLDQNEGTADGPLLAVDIDEALVLPHEWIEEGKPYREFLVLAAILNRHGKVSALTSEEEAAVLRDTKGRARRLLRSPKARSGDHAS